jgi:hypothetical protein
MFVVLERSIEEGLEGGGCWLSHIGNGRNIDKGCGVGPWREDDKRMVGGGGKGLKEERVTASRSISIVAQGNF